MTKTSRAAVAVVAARGAVATPHVVPALRREGEVTARPRERAVAAEAGPGGRRARRA
jgi:hypothetical protein